MKPIALFCSLLLPALTLCAAANKPIRRIETSEPVVALTFDDGPHPENTRKLLDLFKKEGVKATFFVLGKNVKKHPELAKAIVAGGHEIANHTMNHPALPKLKTDEAVKKEIEDNQKMVKQETTKVPTIFRAPFLQYDARTWKVLNALKIPGINASIVTHDYMKSATVSSITTQATDKTRAGDIIMLHTWQNKSVEAMPEIIKRLKAKDLRFVTVSELLKHKK